jgi:hypothetical protein
MFGKLKPALKLSHPCLDHSGSDLNLFGFSAGLSGFG